GAISRSANSRTLFLSCNCSSFSWKSTHGLLIKLNHTGHGQKELPPNAPVEVHSLHHRVLVGRSALTDRLDLKRENSSRKRKCFCGFPLWRFSFVHLRVPSWLDFQPSSTDNRNGSRVRHALQIFYSAR